MAALLKGAAIEEGLVKTTRSRGERVAPISLAWEYRLRFGGDY
jgi:hypothetical protein